MEGHEIRDFCVTLLSWKKTVQLLQIFSATARFHAV